MSITVDTNNLKSLFNSSKADTDEFQTELNKCYNLLGLKSNHIDRYKMIDNMLDFVTDLRDYTNGSYDTKCFVTQLGKYEQIKPSNFVDVAKMCRVDNNNERKIAHETVQPSTVQPSTVQPSTVQPSTVQPSTVQPETMSEEVKSEQDKTTASNDKTTASDDKTTASNDKTTASKDKKKSTASKDKKKSKKETFNEGFGIYRPLFGSYVFELVVIVIIVLLILLLSRQFIMV